MGGLDGPGHACGSPWAGREQLVWQGQAQSILERGLLSTSMSLGTGIHIWADEEDIPDFDNVASRLRLWAESDRNPVPVGSGRKRYSSAHRKIQEKSDSQMHRDFTDVTETRCDFHTCLPQSWLPSWGGLPLKQTDGSCRAERRLGPSLKIK